jgi:hypothetical protein
MTKDAGVNDLLHALDAIERRVDVIRREPDCIEFLTKTNYWIEIMAVPEGWRVRTYLARDIRERVTATVPDALDAAREMARDR